MKLMLILFAILLSLTPNLHLENGSSPIYSNSRHCSVVAHEQKSTEQTSTLKDSSILANSGYIETISTYQYIWLTSLLLGAIVIIFALFYNRKRQKAKTEAITHRLKEIENEYLTLQYEAEPHGTIDKVLADYTMRLRLPDRMTIKYTQSENTDWESIPKEAAFEVYCIVQEAINNSIRHSRASKIVVSLNRKDNLLGISVEDNGTGFNKTRIQKGIGIGTITERTKRIGGMLHLETGRNGTAIKALFII